MLIAPQMSCLYFSPPSLPENMARGCKPRMTAGEAEAPRAPPLRAPWSQGHKEVRTLHMPVIVGSPFSGRLRAEARGPENRGWGGDANPATATPSSWQAGGEAKLSG